MKVETLKSILPKASESKINEYHNLLSGVFLKYGIDTPLRKAHFLSQVLHESGNFRYNEEIASGKAYEGRKDLGNLFKGDGVKFKGRGWIQLTGRANYQQYGKYLGIDLISRPELVATTYRADAAGYFWNRMKLNQLADLGTDLDTIKKITRKINGGLNGIQDRIDKFNLVYFNLSKEIA